MSLPLSEVDEESVEKKKTKSSRHIRLYRIARFSYCGSSDRGGGSSGSERSSFVFDVDVDRHNIFSPHLLRRCRRSPSRAPRLAPAPAPAAQSAAAAATAAASSSTSIAST